MSESSPESKELTLPLHHIATGGTLDSHWDPAQDTAVPNEQSVVPDYLQDVARIPNPTSSETIFLKDSRTIKTADKKLVADKVYESPRQRLVVTSGTYLMSDLGQRLIRHQMRPLLERLDRKIALTGAIVPQKGFISSDAGFNLEMSIATLQSDLCKRIVLIMSGLVLDAETAEKDLTQATFSSRDGNDLLDYNSFSLIPAGGSIDFVLDGLDGLEPEKSSQIPDFLRDSVHLQRSFVSSTPFLKDSREVTPKDRDTLTDIIKAQTNGHILVTSGIFRMEQIQKHLERSLQEGPDKDKRIILTGARLPLNLSDKTDAPFQLGYALGKLGSVKPGINIALNGQLLPADQRKIFEAVYTTREIAKLKAMGVISE